MPPINTLVMKSLVQVPANSPTQLSNVILLESSTDGITAHAGGTQAAAVPLTSKYNNITVCATLNDSVVLPPAKSGLSIVVRNQGAANAAVYPASAAQGGVAGGDKINALAQNALLAVANTPATVAFRCLTDGTWLT